MTTRLAPRQERTLTTDLPDEQILQTAAKALVALGAPDVQVDHTLGCVTGTTRAHGWGWGEHVTIRLEGREAQASTIVIRTDPWMKASLIDWGEASRTIDAIALAFDRAAASPPMATGGDVPVALPSLAGIPADAPDVAPPVPTPPQRPIWEASGDRTDPFTTRPPVRQRNAGTGRRRRVWHFAAGVVAVVCLIGAAVVMQVGGAAFGERVDVMQRVPIPGERVLYVRGPTDFTVFYELRDDGQDDVVAPPLTIEVAREDGRFVPLGRPWIDQTYAIPGHRGRAVATFSADAGEYLLTVDGRAPVHAMVAIGENPFWPLALAALLVSAAVMVMVPVVISAFRQSGRRKEVQTGPQPAFVR
jgi:hypothetical protein